MFVVIFKATVAQLDSNYFETAQLMRQKAFSQYGCLKFESFQENDQEVALSYWPDLASIHAWQQDPEHLMAQNTGRERWYTNYSVEVCEILRQYAGTSTQK
ncbi:antibiotic biosynthesis monooxygenase [Acinetobacter sp. MD2(2019)]|uniref:antibiotic biosynthesis monooxygenase family protein n=1 Tax=Acinetobacter sp. MD2(2019) TaxID=2605273 RepID=UPI002D1F15F8|nr:antibiotic biosynthesis monooxygenase [Acinetobacter sp. MD2(2019)]MEB3752992.1 antibiotic biosynthesis monooxygenase [Acinetobacter sp. MD2(2019)]